MTSAMSFAGMTCEPNLSPSLTLIGRVEVGDVTSPMRSNPRTTVRVNLTVAFPEAPESTAKEPLLAPIAAADVRAQLPVEIAEALVLMANAPPPPPSWAPLPEFHTGEPLFDTGRVEVQMVEHLVPKAVSEDGGEAPEMTLVDADSTPNFNVSAAVGLRVAVLIHPPTPGAVAGQQDQRSPYGVATQLRELLVTPDGFVNEGTHILGTMTRKAAKQS